MTSVEIGLILAQARLRSGRTQAQLAEAMSTTQSAIARAEGGYRMPSVPFINRWAAATGSPIAITFGGAPPPVASRESRRRMVRNVLGPGRFNPWDRKPAPIEADLLERAGLTRSHFERMRQGGRRG